MIIITFDDDAKNARFHANWVGYGYLEQVKREVLEDPDLVYELERGMGCSGLSLESQPPAILDRLLSVMRRVADEAAAGKRQVDVEGRVLDDTAQSQFRRCRTRR